MALISARPCGVYGVKRSWLPSLRRFGRGMFGRDKQPFSEAAPLVSAIRELLESGEGLSEVGWLFDETEPLIPTMISRIERSEALRTVH